MEEDPRAKAHLSLTADAMEEVLALGGIVDQDDQGPVHLGGFAEQVWRVDTPSTSQAPSSLLSAFQRDTTGPVDFDALLQFRARMAQRTSPTPHIQVLDHDAGPPDTLMQAEEDAPMDARPSLPDSFLSHAPQTEPMTQAPHPPSPILVLSDSDHESDHADSMHPTHDRCVPHETGGALYEESDEDSDENVSEDESEEEEDEIQEESEDESEAESEEEGGKESQDKEDEVEVDSEDEAGEGSEEEGGEESQDKEGESQHEGEESEEEEMEAGEEEGMEEGEEKGGEECLDDPKVNETCEEQEGEKRQAEEDEEESGKDQKSPERADENDQDETPIEEPKSQEVHAPSQDRRHQDHPAAAPKDEADQAHDNEYIAEDRSGHAVMPTADLAGSVNPSMLLSRTDADMLASPTQRPLPPPSSHGPYQRLTLSKLTGAPSFIVPSHTFDPHVLEEEGAELDDVLPDGLGMAPLDPDTLPEPVLPSLCRIVGPSTLDDVYVLPSPTSEPAPDAIRKRPRRSSPTAPLQMRLRTPEERRPPRHYSPDL